MIFFILYIKTLIKDHVADSLSLFFFTLITVSQTKYQFKKTDTEAHKARQNKLPTSYMSKAV